VLKLCSSTSSVALRQSAAGRATQAMKSRGFLRKIAQKILKNVDFVVLRAARQDRSMRNA
jgi:hypothetical protein